MNASKLLLAAILLVLTLSCQRGGAASPTAPPAPEEPRELHAISFGRHQSLTGFCRITVDPVTLQAGVSSIERHGTDFAPSPQSNTFDLDAAVLPGVPVLTQDYPIRVVGVKREPNGDVTLTFRHSHPLPAPDPSQPHLGANRADLSYSGRFVLLTDLPANSDPGLNFFIGDSRSPEDSSQNHLGFAANTGVIAHPDGYVFLPHSGGPGDETFTHLADPPDVGGPLPVNADTFPYVLLADDGKRTGGQITGNRVDHSNGGNPKGNYILPALGWQFFPQNANWTGFDFIHAGQTVINSFTIKQSFLNAHGPLTLTAALLLKYIDPQGPPALGTAQDPHPNWFPQNPPDPSHFAYRMPHGAIDASVATMQDLQGLPDEQPVLAISGTPFHLHVKLRDWDAFAPEFAGDISISENLTVIPTGAGGVPAAKVCIPGLSAEQIQLDNQPADGGDGTPGQELDYAGDLTFHFASIADQLFPGMIEFVDPEDTLAAHQDPHHEALNADGQAAVIDPGPPPTAVAVPPVPIITFQTFEVSACKPVIMGVQAIDQASGQPLSVQSDCTSGPAIGTCNAPILFHAIATGQISFLTWIFVGPMNSIYPPRPADVRFTFFAQDLSYNLAEPGLYCAHVSASNADCESEQFNFSFTVGPDNSLQPTWSSWSQLPLGNPPAAGTIGQASSCCVLPAAAGPAYANKIAVAYADHTDRSTRVAILPAIPGSLTETRVIVPHPDPINGQQPNTDVTDTKILATNNFLVVFGRERNSGDLVIAARSFPLTFPQAPPTPDYWTTGDLDTGDVTGTIDAAVAQPNSDAVVVTYRGDDENLYLRFGTLTPGIYPPPPPNPADPFVDFGTLRTVVNRVASGNNVGNYSSVVPLLGNQFAICYFDESLTRLMFTAGTPDPSGWLRGLSSYPYAIDDGGSTDVGEDASMAFITGAAPIGFRLAIAYRGSYPDLAELRFAESDGQSLFPPTASSWNHYVIEGGGVGYENSIAIQNGQIMIAYRDGGAGAYSALKLAASCSLNPQSPLQWNTQFVNPHPALGWNGYVGQECNMIPVGSNPGGLFISYWDDLGQGGVVRNTLGFTLGQ